MQKVFRARVLLLMLLFACVQVTAQESWTKEQKEILTSIERLSGSTASGGTGADGYAAVLAEDYSRWTIGSNLLNTKKAWVEGVREWFDGGWRISDRKQEVLDISVRGDYAFTRRIVEESFLGPDGETTNSKAGLAEIWVRGETGWLLLRVDVDVLDSVRPPK
jgi:ketosteroid isomerase-like protein